MDGNKNRMTSGMFNPKSSRCLIAAVLFIATQTARPDTLINGSFESGDFSGWTVSIPTGTSQYDANGYPDPTIKPAGSAGVFSSWGPNTGMSGPIGPQSGSEFAVIGSAPTANFEGD